MPSELRYLICVLGPTAIGKTSLSIVLANWLNTDIISSDSRQFYKEMSIGTAKPSQDELLQAMHHFIDSHSIHEEFSAGQFEKSTLSLLTKLFKTKNAVLMTGGSGLYMRAVTDGLPDMPEVPEEIRNKLKSQLESEGLDQLLIELKKVDEEFYNQVDKDNPQRVIRGLEVYKATGSPFSSFRKKETKKRPFEIIKIGLEMPRELLYERINKRVDQMISNGLIEEVKNLSQYRDKQALQTVGYKEIFDYLDGQCSLEEAVELIKRNTRRYAKRQLTWFRKEENVNWFDSHDVDGIKQYLRVKLA